MAAPAAGVAGGEEGVIVAADSLRDELLAIPGIDGAELDDDDGVSGVRVQLAAGADPDRVGLAVQRVLATHGMRSTVAPNPISTSGPPPPPGAASVVAFPQGGREGATGHRTVMVPPEATPSGEGSEAEAEPVPVSRPISPPVLDVVMVEEGGAGVMVQVVGRDGSRVERRARSTGKGLDEAVVAAVADLVGANPPPLVVGIHDETVGDAHSVTVVIEVGGAEYRAGAAVVEAGRSFAVAQAAWMALTEPV
jgi:hypothetical protein